MTGSCTPLRGGLPFEQLALRSSEVKQLWWFADGAIMAVDVRHDLWRSWGLCARHAWGYFVVEQELRWQPLGVAILYEDLLGRAAHLLERRWAPLRHRKLVGSQHCFTCDYVSHASREFADFDRPRRRANALQRSRALVRGCEQEWRVRRCPRCCPGSGGPICRPHLLAVATPPWRETAAELRQVLPRLGQCISSLTWNSTSRAATTDAALVEALGWFTGWSATSGTVRDR